MKRKATSRVLAVAGALLFSHSAYPAPALIACMTAHKDEMKALNTQIAELEKTKVAPGGPNTKMGECAHRLHRSGAARRWSQSTRTPSTIARRFPASRSRKRCLSRVASARRRGFSFPSDPAVIDNTLAAQKRLADAQKAARKGSLRNSQEVREIVKEAGKVRGCYSAQVIDILNKSSAAVEKIGRAALVDAYPPLRGSHRTSIGLTPSPLRGTSVAASTYLTPSKIAPKSLCDNRNPRIAGVPLACYQDAGEAVALAAWRWETGDGGEEWSDQARRRQFESPACRTDCGLPQNPADESPGPALRRHGDVRRDPGERARRRHVHHPVDLVSGQRPPDGAADHHRRAAALVGKPDHGGHPVFRLRPAGPQTRPPHTRSRPSWSPT